MSKYLDGDGLKNVWDRLQSDLSKKANAIFETYGPAESVILDVAEAGTILRPVSEIVFVQEGDGTPSPNNIRPISGWDSIRLSCNGREITQDLQEKIYGGTYDWNTGILTVTHKFFSLPIEEISGSDPNTYPGWSVPGILECFKKGSNDTYTPTVSNIGVYTGINTLMQNTLLFLPYIRYHLTADEWKAQHPGLNCQFVFPLLTPKTIRLTSREILAISGNNRFSSDCGNTVVTFQVDMKKVLSKKANAIFETYGPDKNVTIDVAEAATTMEPVSEIVVVQAGEGTPSLDNIRTISGWDEIKLTQNGEVSIMRFGETVYGGTYNWKTGELTITNKYFELKVDDMNAVYDADNYPGWNKLGDDILECFPIGLNSLKTNVICNVGTVVGVNTNQTNRILSLPFSRYNLTQNDWKEQHGGLVCQFVFPLLEPYTIQLIPQEFVASSVSDVFSSDCGDTSVTFQIDIKKYIDKKIEMVLKV